MKIKAISANPADFVELEITPLGWASSLVDFLTNSAAHIVQTMKLAHMPPVANKKSGLRPNLSMTKHIPRATTKLMIFNIPLISRRVWALLTPALVRTSVM